MMSIDNLHNDSLNIQYPLPEEGESGVDETTEFFSFAFRLINSSAGRLPKSPSEDSSPA
jgi:hypothetical protein